MQKLFFLTILLAAPLVFAGPAETTTTTGASTETLAPVPIDYVETEHAYIFESDFTDSRHDFGQQESWQNDFEYAHRFLINGNWYLRAGVNYSRFDFSQTNAPLPVHLQSGAAIIGLDYMHGEDVGAFIQVRPGIYTEDHINLSAFDCPILIGRFWVVKPDQFYILTGLRASFLSAEFPVVPLVGIVWVPSPHWRLMAVPPEPRLIYTVNKQLDIWIGGQFEGSAFRTDHHDDFQFRGGKAAKLSGAVVDYTDIRAGLGLTYSPTDKIDVDLSGGCSVERNFDFSRADQSFRTEPAPYVELEVKAKF
jgi:hypothetical protein